MPDGEEVEGAHLEPGADLDQTEIHAPDEVHDESIDINIITPPAPDPEPETSEHGHPELAHCEHCAEHHARIEKLEEVLAELEEVEAEEHSSPPPEEASTEVEEAAKEEEDVKPKRDMWLHRKLWGSPE